jgi:high-affinity nickel-transport protein
MTTPDLPHDFIGLAALVLLLGLKHGLDADHLAAIDGLTRSNARERPRLARVAGLLFSLGHGGVVMAVALTASALTAAWRVPQWLDAFGAWASIAVLTALALVNIAGVFATPAHEQSTLFGWRSGLFGRWLVAGSAPMILGVGALFAVSFDTLSQATLFAMVATRFGGAQASALLAALFIGGMLLTDGANGLWIARLIRRSDQRARIASRVMGLTVAGVGLLTAALGVAVQTSASAEAWTEGKELWIGAAVIGVMLLSYGLALRLARRAPATAC